jgi:Rdx family protein
VRAASLAAELNGNGFDATIHEGENSQFDVIADGKLVFSKQQAGRHAEPGEVLGLLRA